VVQPRNNYEQQLLKIWQHITDQDRVSIDDRLFDAGGNSLVLIRFHAILVEDADGHFDGRFAELKISDFFKLPTVRKISDYIQSREPQSVVPDSLPSIMEEKRRRMLNRQSLRKSKEQE